MKSSFLIELEETSSTVRVLCPETSFAWHVIGWKAKTQTLQSGRW